MAPTSASERTTLPLCALFAQALAALTLEYRSRGADNDGLTTLAVWSNVLRPIGEGIELAELPTAARLSKRAVRAAVGAAEKRGWILRDETLVRLSPAGDKARERWPDLDTEVEASVDWDVDGPLRLLVRQLHLEWPHHPTGYGPADHSITGGIYAGGGRTDSTVPTHGTDWSPVVRHDVEGSSVAGLPRSALLSQAFVAFAADFEELWIGGLHLAATVLRLLPDEGAPSAEIPALARLKGDGKSTLERHGFIEIMRDAANPKVRIAVPTARGRNTRDEYLPTTARVEDRWRSKYGADLIAQLRSTFGSLDLDRGLPHSVIDTLTWAT